MARKGVFRLIEKHLANFFWGSSEDHKKYHWSSCNHLARPFDEGGIRIRKMEDISNYHAWGHVLKMREIAENHIVWQVNSGSSNFWWDNWSLHGPLAKQLPNTPKNSKLLVRKFISEGQWNINKLKDLLPDQMVRQVQIVPIGNQNKEDQIFWAPSENGKFSNKSAWNLITWSIEAAVNKAYPNSGLKLPWNNFCDTLTSLRPEHKSLVVRWLKSDRGWVKLNTNGSFLQREGKAGLGGAIRDDQGDIFMAFSTPVTAQNHNIAEAQATLFGLNWCKQNDFNEVIWELDSLYIIEILRNDADTNYNLSHIVSKIKDIISAQHSD
uniref:Uncharacterized protein LOC104246415 n=1 Tax=Nicotiana sylvestris TaxID=4096 RepID=A0A1U7Y8T3_NICSY|nr:PREDICTED: uncharacterized protein LOC104246415 [Nicotiana sylvestris]